MLKDADTAWPKTVLVLSKLVLLRPNQLVEYADALVDSFPFLLNSSVPRKVQSLCSAIWYKLNTVIPRRFVSLYFHYFLQSTAFLQAKGIKENERCSSLEPL